MATLPESAGFGTELVLASQPSLTWLIDKEQNQVSRMDEGLEAVRQAVEIALSVERFRWQISRQPAGTLLTCTDMTALFTEAG